MTAAAGSPPPKPSWRYRAKRLEYKVGLYMVTSICGLIDAVCYLALGGVFAEMMTGNMLLFALSAGTGAALGDLSRYASAILAFIVGALIGGRLLRGPQKVRERRMGFAVEWFLVILATVVAAVGHPDDKNLMGQVVVALLAMAMGIHNAMVRVHGVPDLATNVMTLTFAGLISDSSAAKGDNKNWERRLLSILLFVGSAGVGATLLHFFGVVAPLLLACVVLTLALYPLMFGIQSATPGALPPAPAAKTPGESTDSPQSRA